MIKNYWFFGNISICFKWFLRCYGISCVFFFSVWMGLKLLLMSVKEGNVWYEIFFIWIFKFFLLCLFC